MTPTTAAGRAERRDIPLPSGPDNPACPKCSGRMWDNRATKRNPRAPDFKCRDRACDGVLWPGQQRKAIPAVSGPTLAVVKGGQPDESTAEQTPPLRTRYLDITHFVIQSVRPRYEQNGLECGADTVAAIAATLYIAETRREGL
jgi:hypothetical protein